MIRAAIDGGAGYVAGELLRLLLRHPDVAIRSVASRSHAGRPIHDAHPDLVGVSDLTFAPEAEIDADVDVLFLCSGHGASRRYLGERAIPASVRIIDMSSDYRLAEDATEGERRFIYGLPELRRDAIRAATAIANPGCFATALQLALLPAAAAAGLIDDVHVTALTGSTGAGAGLSETTHFTWREGNVSVYKPFAHQHLDEITAGVRTLAPGFAHPIRFVPLRGNFTRGIFATLHTRTTLDASEITRIYDDFYADHPFTLHVVPPDLKPVVNTNRCLLHATRHDDLLFVTVALDNLLKGASGQAVQNMNLMFGLDERAGLDLKGTGF
jgi:N-acetyl-gamma-glutamyl-phosphate reductase